MGPLLTAASTYREKGWHLLGLKTTSKQPIRKWAGQPSWEPAEFAETNNLGVVLGEKSNGLVDLDCDWPESAQIAGLMFKDLPAFGRATSPGSHRVAICPNPKAKTFFNLPSDLPGVLRRGTSAEHQTGVMEIRGSGHYTMFPPSVHPCGERLAWHSGYDNIPTYPWEHLLRECGICAFLAVILRAYPRQSGDRDTICLALTGTLLSSGLDSSRVDAFVTLVAQQAGDEEADRRGGKATATKERIRAGQTYWGLPELCRRLGIESVESVLRNWLGNAAEAPREGELLNGAGAEILIAPGRLVTIVDEAEDALIRAKCPMYQRGDTLVRTARLDRSGEDRGVRRAQGSNVLVPVGHFWLVEEMARSARWVRMNANGTQIPTDPSNKYALHYLDRVGSWRVPVLLGVLEAPTLRSDGSLLQVPGYDSESQLLFDPGQTDFPPIPENPTKEDARTALDELLSLFAKFPFVDDAARSVAIAGVLTVFVRRSLRTAPLFAIDAPTAGTGKSLIAEVIGILATGHTPPMMSQGKTADEDEKRLGAALMAGDGIIVIDNCERQVEGDFLCSMLTQEVVQTRILGRSQTIRLPSNSVVIATGNNLTLSGDMTRRAVCCRLDARCEHPDARQFTFDPRAVARERRADFVVAGLTVLRAYVVAGRPGQLDKIGGFEDWTWVREALVWLGMADPALTRQQILHSDPRKADLVELLLTWESCFGRKEMSLAQIRAACEAQRPSADCATLYHLLVDYSGRPQFNAKSIGRYLSRHIDRVAGGMTLRRRGNGKQGALYWVEVTGDQLPLVGEGFTGMGDLEQPEEVHSHRRTAYCW